MCRHNQMLGICFLSFGLGLLIGQCVSSGLFCSILAVAVIIFGFGLLRQKY